MTDIDAAARLKRYTLKAAVGASGLRRFMVLLTTRHVHVAAMLKQHKRDSVWRVRYAALARRHCRPTVACSQPFNYGGGTQ